MTRFIPSYAERYDEQQISEITARFGVPPLVARALIRRGALGHAEYEACMLRLFRLHPAPHGPPEGIDTEYAKGGA